MNNIKDEQKEKKHKILLQMVTCMTNMLKALETLNTLEEKPQGEQEQRQCEECKDIIVAGYAKLKSFIPFIDIYSPEHEYLRRFVSSIERSVNKLDDAAKETPVTFN